MVTTKSLGSLPSDFVDHLRSRRRASATILAYRKDIEQIINFLKKNGKEAPEEVMPEDIEAFRDSLAKGGYTAKSVSRKLNAVKTFFRWVVASGLLKIDPAAPVAHPRYENPPPRILSPMEYRALRDASRDDERIAAIIELMLQTGIRIGEVANLELEDIKGDELVIRPYESQPGRVAPLNEAARKALETYSATRPQSRTRSVFVTKTGRSLLVRNIRSAIDRYFREAQIKDAKVNDLRNTFIAHHLRVGVDIVTLSRIAGHKRLSTTERYLAFVDRREPGRTTKLGEL